MRFNGVLRSNSRNVIPALGCFYRAEGFDDEASLTPGQSVCSWQLRYLFASCLKPEASRPVALRSRVDKILATLPFFRSPCCLNIFPGQIDRKQTDLLQKFCLKALRITVITFTVL